MAKRLKPYDIILRQTINESASFHHLGYVAGTTVSDARDNFIEDNPGYDPDALEVREVKLDGFRIKVEER